MKSGRIATTTILARALRYAKAPSEMIERAKAGAYDDFKSQSATPISDLIHDAWAAGLTEIVRRAKRGEFDAQTWEVNEWARSPEGREFFHELAEGW